MQGKRNRNRFFVTVMLLTLCVIGSKIEIATAGALVVPFAFLGAILLGRWYGFFLGSAAHLISACLEFFPWTIPVHLTVALTIGVSLFVFGHLRHNKGDLKLRKILASDAIVFAINVFLPVVLLIPVTSVLEMALTFSIPLTIATVINLVWCEVIYFACKVQL